MNQFECRACRRLWYQDGNLRVQWCPGCGKDISHPCEHNNRGFWEDSVTDMREELETVRDLLASKKFNCDECRSSDKGELLREVNKLKQKLSNAEYELKRTQNDFEDKATGLEAKITEWKTLAISRMCELDRMSKTVTDLRIEREQLKEELITWEIGNGSFFGQRKKRKINEDVPLLEKGDEDDIDEGIRSEQALAVGADFQFQNKQGATVNVGGIEGVTPSETDIEAELDRVNDLTF